MGDKYDRQLRLWGAEGQRRLGGAHVLLLGAGATGAETLKNLVLPGVQRVTVLDGQRVTRADASNSFFVTADAVGRARAQVVAELLLEMNGDVAGAAREADPLSVLQHGACRVRV
jgi:amyloid beta precursor protein binding protein 1